MTINEAIKKFSLPNPTTLEDLECHWHSVLEFGDKVLLAGYHYQGKRHPRYFGAVYELLSNERLTCEEPIGLAVVSDVEFEDNGHAIAWAMSQCDVGGHNEKV